jgi:protein disulfide-isomerase-like protein
MPLVLAEEASGAVESEGAPGKAEDDVSVWDDSGRVVHMSAGEDMSNWDGFKEKNSKIFAFFYAPWCGHCKTFKPVFIEASTKTKGVPFVAVDCTKEKELCNKYDVKGYPRIVYFASSEDQTGQDYNGPRDSFDDVKVYLENKVEAESRKALAGGGEMTEAELKKLRVRALKRMLKERGATCKGCTDKSEFVAKMLKVQSKKVKKAERPKSGMSLMEERRYKKAKEVADKGWSDLDDGNGKVVHLIDQEWTKFRTDNEASLIMFYAPWCGHCKSLKPKWVEASTAVDEDEQLKGKAVVAAMDCDSNEQTCGKFGVESFPTIIWFDSKDSKGAPFKGERDADGIKNFLTAKLVGGGADAVEADKNWDKDHPGKVQHAAEASFTDLRKDNPQMLVMFYGPAAECAGCKKMMQPFAEASEKVDGVVPLVAMDCSLNEAACKGLGIKKLRSPLLKYYDTSDDAKGAVVKKKKVADIVAFVASKEEAGDDEL